MDTSIQNEPPAPTGVATVATLPPDQARPNPDEAVRITFLNCLRWMLLGTVPVMLKSSVVTLVVTDFSPIPYIWMVGEGLYWLSWLIVIPGVLVMRRTALLAHRWLAMLQAVAIVAGLFVLLHMSLTTTDARWVIFSIVTLFSVLLLAALVCHAELLRDSLCVTHLWVLVVCASLGNAAGAVGAMYLWPICFHTALYDFVLPLILACLLRPTLPLRALFRLQPLEAGTHRLRRYALDVTLPIVLGVLTFGTLWFAGLWQANRAADAPAWQSATVIFAIALGLCLLLSLRPWRFGIALGFMVMLHTWQQPPTAPDTTRSYFGTIHVKPGVEVQDGEKNPRQYRELIHGHVGQGLQFQKEGNDAKDLSRLATTYYHREGPVGRVMDKFNWLPQLAKPQAADVRLPASIVGLGAVNIGALPAGELVGVWSEPPIAVIGLGTGTMASYARPYQHIHFYEVDDEIVELSLPKEKKEPAFTFVRDAMRRGVIVKVLMGDARMRMSRPYQPDGNQTKDAHVKGGAPDAFYQIMVVDAFTGDAIPVHLITQEAIKVYFSKLNEEGLLCIHATNRYVDLPSVVASTAKSLDLAFVHGKDRLPSTGKERMPSEWVIVARKAAYLKHLREPDGYREKLREHLKRIGRPNEPLTPYWEATIADPQEPWSDDISHILRALRKEQPR